MTECTILFGHGVSNVCVAILMFLILRMTGGIMSNEFYVKKVIEVENQLTAFLIKESLQIMQNNGFFEYQIYKHPGKLKYTITIFKKEE